jgi:hypothetical protein
MTATNIGECHQKSHVPNWEMVRLDVFNKLTTCEAMMGVEEETEYGVRVKQLPRMLQLVTMLLCHVKMVMENNFGYCFVTNLSKLWWKTSLILIKIPTTKEITSFVGVSMTYYNSKSKHIISMRR